MKNTLLFLGLIIIIFSSCSPTIYQIDEIQSNNVVMRKDTFVYEDSIFKITYDLWSSGGVMNFKIYNKDSVHPVYIDWNKSNFIVQGQSLDDWEDKETTKNTGVSNSGTYVNWWYKPYTVINNLPDYLTTTLNTSISIKEKIKPENQIPPHSYIERQTFAIQFPFYMPKNNIKNKDSLVTHCDKCFDLRNFIAWTKNQDLTNIKFINNDFWLYKQVSLVNNDYMNDADFNKAHYSPNSFYTEGGFIYPQAPTGVSNKSYDK